MKKNILCPVWLLILGVGTCLGQGTSRDSTLKLGFKSSGYVFLESYRLWDANYNGDDFKGDWYNNVLGGFVLENNISEQLSTRVSLEANFSRPFPSSTPGSSQQHQSQDNVTSSSVYLQEAKAVYSWNSRLEMEAGYFIYKYNKEDHNLGEYLFRSGIYPLTLNTSFDFAQDKLLGIRLGNRPFKGFHQDLLLTSDYQGYPKSDFTLSYLADYTINNSRGQVLQFGAGVSFVNLIPVQPSLESPHGAIDQDNIYYQIPVQTWTDSSGVKHQITTPINGFIDQIPPDLTYQATSQSLGIDPGIQHTTTAYTYQGTKLMARLSLDPKPLFDALSWLGPEDLKLYSETAILGVKDYAYYYNDIWQRMPVMVGFNFPGFRILDVIGMEVEYCSNPWPNDNTSSIQNGFPTPGAGEENTTTTTHDNWNWSLYVRKAITRGIFISAQAACDHLRLPDQNGFTYASLMTDTGLPFSRNWWGIVRLTANY